MCIRKNREKTTEFLLSHKRFPLKWITLSFHKDSKATKSNKGHLNRYSGRLHCLTTKDTAGILEAELILPRYNGILCFHLHQLPRSWSPLLLHLREDGKEGNSTLLQRASREQGNSHKQFSMDPIMKDVTCVCLRDSNE